MPGVLERVDEIDRERFGAFLKRRWERNGVGFASPRLPGVP
jgi:hypothetical protein